MNLRGEPYRGFASRSYRRAVWAFCLYHALTEAYDRELTPHRLPDGTADINAPHDGVYSVRGCSTQFARAMHARLDADLTGIDKDTQDAAKREVGRWTHFERLQYLAQPVPSTGEGDET